METTSTSAVMLTSDGHGRQVGKEKQMSDNLAPRCAGENVGLGLKS